MDWFNIMIYRKAASKKLVSSHHRPWYVLWGHSVMREGYGGRGGARSHSGRSQMGGGGGDGIL